MQSNGVADGLKPTNEDVQSEQSPNDLRGNTKLWLGKDYSNFIRKDWVQLDKPFEGTSSSSARLAAIHSRKIFYSFPHPSKYKLSSEKHMIACHHHAYVTGR